MNNKKRKYEMANFLREDKNFDEKKYSKWLDSQASRHYTRDKKYFDKHNNSFADETKENYKKAIHKAVCNSKGKDFYTGKDLSWDQINEWKNEEAKINKDYKKSFKDLPTVDHINRVNFHKEIKFVICSWSVNDAKNDLTVEEFLELCECVVEYSKSKKDLI